MRATLRIPPAPDRLHAAGCTPDALASRERFVRSAADAWAQAGHRDAADRLSVVADALRLRFAAVSSTHERHGRGCDPARA